VWFSDALRRLFASHYIEDYLAPWDWALRFVSFRRCKSAEHGRLLPNVAPYLIDPVNCFDFSGIRRELTVVAPQQTGKTLVWLCGLLWSFIYKPCLS
jgi:phage terminase large subunit GpA-like protein